LPLPSLAPLAPITGASDSQQPVPGKTDAAATGPEWLTGTIAQITVIVLGVVLIIAGLFSFKQVREIAATAA
jgi:hypothetical protein